MATMKRRVIYFSDEMWAMVKRHAEQHGLSISDWLRALVVTDAFEEQEAKRGKEPTIAVSATGRPFIEYRPAPKSGRGGS